MLKTLNKISLFFLLFAIIILSFSPKIEATQLTDLGTYSYSGVTNYNPAYVIVYDNQTSQNIGLYVYAYDTTIKIWRISDAKLLDTISVSLPATKLWGYGIFRYMGYGSLDGFWIIALSSNDVDNTITVYVRAWFYNFTDKTCTQLSSDKSVNLWSYTAQSNQVSDYLISWGNPIWQNNYEFISWSAHVKFYYTGTIDPGWHSEYLVGIIQVSNSQHLGSLALVYNWNTVNNAYIGFQPYISLTFPFDPTPSLVLGGYVYKEYGQTNPTFLYAVWDTGGTFTVYSGNTYSYSGYANVLLRAINYRPMFKPIGFQYSISSGKVYWYWYLGLAYTDISQTKMQQGIASVIINSLTLQSPNVNTIYIINGVVYNVDERDPYTAITNSYFYHSNGYIFNVGYNQTQGLSTVTVDLGLSSLDLDYNVFITGQYTFFKFLPSTNQIKLYIIATEIPTVYTIPIQPPNPPTTPEDTSYPTYIISTLMGVIVPFMFLFIPAFVLTGMIGKMGFVAGLMIGGVLLVMANLLPMWAVFLIGLGIVALIWSSTRRGEVE